MAVTRQLSFDPISAQQVEHFSICVIFSQPLSHLFLFSFFFRLSYFAPFFFFQSLAPCDELRPRCLLLRKPTFMAFCLKIKMRMCKKNMNGLPFFFSRFFFFVFSTKNTIDARATKRRKRDENAH